MLELIKQIREETGAGIVDIKKALEESSGDKKEALAILKKRGLQKADKKASRIAGEGLVVSYIHADGKNGTLLKLLCETDFVAKNDDFKTLANDIAMQIVAMNPLALKVGDISDDMIETEIEELKKKGLDKIKLEQEIEKIKKEKSLYGQKFIKNPEITIEELIKDKIATMGENIKVDKFVKMTI